MSEELEYEEVETVVYTTTEEVEVGEEDPWEATVQPLDGDAEGDFYFYEEEGGESGWVIEDDVDGYDYFFEGSYEDE